VIEHHKPEICSINVSTILGLDTGWEARRPGSWEAGMLDAGYWILGKKEIENRKEERVKTCDDSHEGFSIFSFLITLFYFLFEL